VFAGQRSFLDRWPPKRRTKNSNGTLSHWRCTQPAEVALPGPRDRIIYSPDVADVMKPLGPRLWVIAALFAVALTACDGSGTKNPQISTTTTKVTTVSTTAPPSTNAAPTDSAIGVYGNCTIPSVEPVEIVLACADYGILLQGLHWTSWTAVGATAVGTLVYNDCVPDCADGHDHRVAGTTVTLSVPVHGKGGSLVWSEVQEHPEPPGYATGPYQGGPQPLPTQPD
jgi:hypothetical protein